jgi:hypothetical protein
MSKEEYQTILSKALRNVKQPRDVDIEEIQRLIEEQYKSVEDLQQWSDKLLKN